MGQNTKTFTIEVEMQERWIPHFLGMLKYMQSFGSMGHSGTIEFYADGDGDFRPKFTWDESLPSPAKSRTEDNFQTNPFFDAG